MKEQNKVLLVICDGLGDNPSTFYNAVREAKMPHLNQLRSQEFYTTLEPGGPQVGLPEGVAGNSEVGHINIGAGRPVRQDLIRINELIESNEFMSQENLKELINQAIKTKRLHLMSLFSDGGVHSHMNHLFHVIDFFHQNHPDIEIFLHLFLDGRDTPKKYFEQNFLELKARLNHKTSIATIGGRSLGMDRDSRYEKVKLHYDAMTKASPLLENISALDYVHSQYEKNITDEFVTPVCLNEKGMLLESDVLFFLNFRPDRARQISLAFTDPNFKEFERAIRPKYFINMSPCIEEELPESPYVIGPEPLEGSLIEHLNHHHKKVFKIAETEKYAHVTYFFNAGIKKPFANETRVLIDSPRDVQTYNLKPQMSAYEVKDKLISALRESEHDLYVVNFANPDMVGHTGDFEATIRACEVVDECLGELSTFCKNHNIIMMITADHGNADQMKYEDLSPHTSHSKSKVPLIIQGLQVSEEQKKNIYSKQNHYCLAHIAPTILDLLGVEDNKHFTFDSILRT